MKTLFLDPAFGRIWEQTCPDLTETHQKSEGKNALPNSQPLPSQSQAEGDLGGKWKIETMLPKRLLPPILGSNKQCLST